MDDTVSIFIPFEKKDNDERVVEGYASTEALDSQGEIVKADALEEALPDYMKFGNIREMHQMSAVGKTISAKVDSKKKGLYISGKVVDDNAWKKVKEGVYNGFSIGGRVLKRIGNTIHSLSLSEISLVDRPANPEAVFSLVKFDRVNKDGGDTTMDENKHEGIYTAGEFLRLAAELCFLYSMFERDEKDTSDIEVAIDTLKDLAVKELEGDTSEESKKLFGLFDDMEKKKLSSGDRKDMPAGEFAYVDSEGGKHLPIGDAAHARNAMARFNQTQFSDAGKKANAARKIIRAAHRFGVEVSQDSAVSQAAKKADIVDFIKADSWTTEYYDIARKVNG